MEGSAVVILPRAGPREIQVSKLLVLVVLCPVRVDDNLLG